MNRPRRVLNAPVVLALVSFAWMVAIVLSLTVWTAVSLTVVAP